MRRETIRRLYGPLHQGPKLRKIRRNFVEFYDRSRTVSVRRRYLYAIVTARGSIEVESLVPAAADLQQQFRISPDPCADARQHNQRSDPLSGELQVV